MIDLTHLLSEFFHHKLSSCHTALRANRYLVELLGLYVFRPNEIMNVKKLTFLQRAAKLALQAMYMLRQIRPSVRPSLSVTLRYCVKTRERRRMRSSHSGSAMPLVL